MKEYEVVWNEIHRRTVSAESPEEAIAIATDDEFNDATTEFIPESVDITSVREGDS